MPIKTEAWKCQYCNMVSLTKANVTRHEKMNCQKNKACEICDHFWTDYVDDGIDEIDGGGNWIEWYCLVDSNDGEKLDDKKRNCPKFKVKEESDED